MNYIEDGEYKSNTPKPQQVNEFNWNWLPSQLIDYGQNMCTINKLSEKMMATAMLITASAAVGRNCYITPNPHNQTWKVRCNLWGVSTAPAGSRKSEVLSKATAPIHREQTEIAKIWREELEDWLEEEMKFKVRKKNFENKLKMLNGKAMDDLEAPKIKAKPVKTYYIATDITAERIPSFISNAKGSAFAVFDEMSAFFQSTGGNSSRNTGAEARATYLSAWSGDGKDVRLRQDDTKETADHGASISIYGMAQPDIIANHVHEYKKSRDGFFSRFQLVTYETDYNIYRKATIPFDQKASDIYGAMIVKLLNFSRKNPFYFDEHSLPVFDDWEHSNEMNLKKYNDRKDYLMAEVIAKRTKVVCALALVMHLIDEFENGIEEPRGAISLKALNNAISLNTFYVNEIKRVVGSEEKREMDQDDMSDKIQEWLMDPVNSHLVLKGATASAISMDLRKKGERPSAETILRIAKDLGYKVKSRRIFK